MKNRMKQWDLETMSNIMMACIIMHNMILEDKHDLRLKPICNWRLSKGCARHEFSFCGLQLGTKKIENVHAHFALHNDLIDHL